MKSFEMAENTNKVRAGDFDQCDLNVLPKAPAV
jgi:hypothetical protein